MGRATLPFSNSHRSSGWAGRLPGRGEGRIRPSGPQAAQLLPFPAHVPPPLCFQILTKTGELPRQPTTHPEETEEELTEQQEALLGEGALTIPREGSTESESTQEDLEEEEEEEEDEEEEEEEDCIQVKDEEGESGAEEGPDLEESSAGYKKVPPPPHPLITTPLSPCSFARLPSLSLVYGFQAVQEQLF